MAEEVQRITDPSILSESNMESDITIGLVSLSITINISPKPPPTETMTRQAKLALLQPLANPTMFAACRNSDSRVRLGEDSLVRSTSKYEYLNIRPLSLAWRRAVTMVPPFTELTFELTLPTHKGDAEIMSDAFPKVYWDTAVPIEGGLAVRTRDIMTLVITLATGTRMRANGELRFGVTYDGTEGVSIRAMKLLEKQLLALGAKYNDLVKD